MEILIMMCLGILVGNVLAAKPVRKVNEKIQMVCTLLLIFSMGVMLGQKENFLSELSSMGFMSFLFFLIPTALSIVFVYYLTKYFLMKKERKNEVKEF